jgi:spore coat protein A
MMATRRQFLKLSTAVGAGLYLYHTLGPVARVFGKTPAVGTLAPSDIPKYAEPLIIPPAMPSSGTKVVQGGKNADFYEIAVRQFQQNILPASMGRPTTVWSYGSVNHPGTFNYPAFTIEARVDKLVRVKWINQLVDANGNYLQHLLPVDPTLHWANPPGPRDERPTFSSTPGRYTGPVPITTHLHGGHNAEESDGYAEA